jgi:anti-sigma factor RsiW
MACRQAVELMTDYLDGALSSADHARLEVHLAGCANCSAYLAQLRAVIEAAGHVEPDELSPEALGELVDLYRRWKTE